MLLRGKSNDDTSYLKERVSKDEFEKALRAHRYDRDAQDEMRSE